MNEFKSGRDIIAFFEKKLKTVTGGGSEASCAETSSVASASMMLQISEFQFFHLAHEQWFGRRISDSMMEPIFSRYMFDEIVPFWVRQFTRKVCELAKQGRLNPIDFNVNRPEATPEMKATGQWNMIMLFLILIFFCIMISGFEPY